MGMSNYSPTLPYNSAPQSNKVQAAQAELASAEAFAEAQKTFAEPTPKAPNTEDNGNSRVQTTGHEVGMQTSRAVETSTSAPTRSTQREPSAADSFQSTSSAQTTSAAQPSKQAGGSAADQLDTSARPSTSSTTAAQTTTSDVSVSDHSSLTLEASMAHDLASIAGTNQTTTVRVESLGNPDAMTRELLNAIRDSGANSPQIASPSTQAALSAMTQKTVDNIPHLLVEDNDGKGVKLFVPDSSAINQVQAAEARVLMSDSARVQAAAELSQGPDWPHLMLEALAKSNDAWQARFPDSNPLANAMMALYGREVSVAHAGAHEDILIKLASLANPPLNLPAAGLMRDDANQLAAFHVQSTHVAADNQLWVTVMDVPASLEAGREVHKSIEAEQFARAVFVLVVPDGRPAVAIQKQHEADLHTLGLIGCCLTANGGGSLRQASSLRTSATSGHGSGLLENRCVTCARAQLMCQPKLV